MQVWNLLLRNRAAHAGRPFRHRSGHDSQGCAQRNQNFPYFRSGNLPNVAKALVRRINREDLMNHLKTAALAATIAMSGASVQAQDDGANYILATASTGGTYYPVGVALATLAKVKLEPEQNIGMNAISSAGSGENVRLIREGEAQFGILQGLFGYYARTGTGPVEADGPQEHLRSVTLLWPNVEHFIVANEHADTGTFSDFLDLTGEPVALGRMNSGTIGSNAAILANFDIDLYEDFTLIEGGYGPSAEALQNGQAEASRHPRATRSARSAS